MGHKPRKRFGQNFLQDSFYQQKIADSVRATNGSAVVEIGPGKGAITQHLIHKTGFISAIEMDRDLVALLEARFPREQLAVHQGDVLNFDFQPLIDQSEQGLTVVGNLPYNISTPLIFHLLSYAGGIKDMVFMLQKEVVDRMCANEDSKTYGKLSVMTALDAVAQPLFDVPPGAFFPAPKVMSTVVRLTPRAARLVDVDRSALNQVVSAAFGQRRKTLRNALAKLMTEAEITALGIDATLRAENLSVQEYCTLAKYYETNAAL